MSDKPTETKLGPPHPLNHLVAAGLGGAIIGATDGLMAANASGLASLSGSATTALIALTIALMVPVTAAAGLFSGLFLRLGWRWLSPAAIKKALAHTRVKILLLLLILGIGGAGYFLGQKLQIEWEAISWTLPILGGAGLVLYALICRLIRGLTNPKRLLGLALVIGLALASVATYASQQTSQGESLARLNAKTHATRYLLAILVRASDTDKDGYPTSFCGTGCDCDDSNPAIHPGATDIPGNDIDEDCSGQDATAADLEEFATHFKKKPVAPKPVKEQVKSQRALLPKGPGSAPAAAPVEAKDKPHEWKLSRPGLPNVLLIVIDTLRADHLGVYGFHRPTSPRIDAWSKHAVVFDQARSTGPSTRFSVPPLLIGKYFTEISRSRSEWPRIGDEELLLGERMLAAKYHTCAFHSIRYFRPKYGMSQGFTHYSIQALRKRGPPLKMISSDFITDEALAYADKVLVKQKDKPFFMWAYYGDPHSAYMKHKGFPIFGPKYRDTYDNEIVFTDHHVGRLMDGLEKRGLMKDTIVILTSDHGEGLDPKEDHGTRYHSKNLYDELIRIPLIISGPGFKPGRVKTPVSLIDIVPTVTEWLGNPPEEKLRGVSLMPYLKGKNPKHPPVFFEKHRAKDSPQKGMVMWPYKIIQTLPYQHFEIYNLEKDPKERKNLFKTLPERERKRLIGVLNHWSTQVLKPYGRNTRH